MLATGQITLFQSTLPCGSDAVGAFFILCHCISIHAPLRERHLVQVLVVNVGTISIHAPLRERLPFCQQYHGRRDFNPRSLAGATRHWHPLPTSPTNFNPRSLAGATAITHSTVNDLCISIHAPLRERRTREQQYLKAALISIHAPLRERPISNDLPDN